MNRAERRTRKPRVCEAEVAFTDFDGSQASAPCGWPATRLLTLFTRQGWLPGAPRTVTRVLACTEHASEEQAREYGLEAVISRPV